MRIHGIMRIYFMGICGTAMGNAALLVRAAGHEVLGADSGVYPPMSTVLAAAGISLHEGYDPARLEKLAPDLVVIGNAMSRGNPEVEWLLAGRAIPFTSLPALLHDHILARRDNIVVCGTHGKTTTTAMTAFLLRENGCDPGFLIGGVPQDPPVGNHLGAPADPFVIEGDEYDSAFFDKRSKFIHYAPRVAILNNLEFDHADIFRDLADVKRTFTHLTRLVPGNGAIVFNGDDANLCEVVEKVTWCKILGVGTGENNFVRIADFSEDADGISFTLLWNGAEWTKIRMATPGLYNARNAAMAAVATALSLGGAKPPAESQALVFPNNFGLTGGFAPPKESLHIAGPFARFRGVKRRQETLVATPALTVVEDFGHHPTAIAETLKSFRNRFPGATLTAVFEPRSNTARTRALQDDFAATLVFADEVYLGPVNRAEKLSADERFDTAAVIQQLAARDIRAGAFSSNIALLEKLTAATLPADPSNPRAVIFFSNGSFDGIIAKYAKAAA
ncbi:UDP-N-acetylmuramate--L-alanine ligase [Ereboglobus luteus]|nr:Mur ligase family protein [Ereboglobus luteus]